MSLSTLVTSAKTFAAARPVAAAAIAVGTGVAVAGGIYGGVRLHRYYRAQAVLKQLSAPVVVETPSVNDDAAGDTAAA